MSNFVSWVIQLYMDFRKLMPHTYQFLDHSCIESKTVSLSDVTNQSSLESPADRGEGKYKCVAVNPHGTVEKMVDVEVSPILHHYCCQSIQVLP